MSGKYSFRFLISLSTVIITIVALITVACAQREVKKETKAIETPAKIEGALAPKTPPAPEPKAKEEVKTAQAKPSPEQAPTAPVTKPAPTPTPTPAPAAPAVKPTPTPAAKIPPQYKDIDPSLLIYLSERGVLAGTGDPTGVAGEAEKIGMAEHPAAMELAKLPKDKYGLVDWAVAIKTGQVKPLDSLDPGATVAPPFNLDIVIKTKSNFMNDVVFPHYTHTLWLTCTNCHTGIFQMKAGGNPEMTMPKIASGEYCGRCHNRVAFPLTDCTRCHVKPKEATQKAR